jgi:hypothetical protein
MKYSLRFVWYVLRIVIIAASAFAILVVAFFIAMDSANVYVIVTDGMKARATAALMPGQGVDVSKYFTQGYLDKQSTMDNSGYATFVITDFDYRISVESLWCNPWKSTATVTVVESIPDFTFTGSVQESEDKASAEPPAWPRARYKIYCIRENDVWRIDSLEKVESLPPEPTLSPEPSSYITASPLPTSTLPPSMNPSTLPSAEVSASPTGSQ